MTVIVATEAGTEIFSVSALDKLRDPAWQAAILLRSVLAVAFIAVGLDKFFNLLTYWPQYLAPVATDIAPLDGQPFMYVVGVIEIALGLAVLFVPRYGAILVAGWLGFIIANLVVLHGYYDVALRDLGLLVAALALFRLTFHRTAPIANRRQEHSHD